MIDFAFARADAASNPSIQKLAGLTGLMVSMSSPQTEPAAPSAAGVHCEGIGGWLILLAISQVLGVAAFSATMISNFSSLPVGTASLMPLAMIGAVAIESALLLLLIYTAFLFFSKSRRFPVTFIVSCVAGLIEPLALAVWLAVATGGDMLAYVTSSVTVHYLASVVGCVLWIAYVVRSVRVRNTFVH